MVWFIHYDSTAQYNVTFLLQEKSMMLQSFLMVCKIITSSCSAVIHFRL